MASGIKGLPRPLRKQFKAARMMPCVYKWLTQKPKVLQYFAAVRVTVEDDRDYRYVEVTDGEVLLVTPKGLETLALKQELFTIGWRDFLRNHPDFLVYTKDEMVMMEIPPGATFPEPTLVFARSIKTGDLRKSAILYPNVELVGKRDAQN